MKITLFTSNQYRHNYFINLLSKIATELYVVQESRTIFPGKIESHYMASKKMDQYFSEVINAEKRLFGECFINGKNKNIHILPLSQNDLKKCSLHFLNQFLQSDLFIVCGSSYIKGELADFLVKKKTINIHMGISPFYRGTDCNFWALYDDNADFVGSTIHLLSKGLDSGPILYHALSEIRDDPFIYTMSTVKSAFESLAERIEKKTIFNYQIIDQEKKKELRYSTKKDFTDNKVKKYFKKKINLKKKLNLNLFKDPYVLKKND